MKAYQIKMVNDGYGKNIVIFAEHIVNRVSLEERSMECKVNYEEFINKFITYSYTFKL